MFDDNGKENFTMSSEVTELSSATLDAALFDVPGDYREVKDATELYASMSNDSSANNKTKNDYSPKSNSSNTTSLSSDAPAAVTSAIKSSSDPARKKTAWMKEFSAATPTNRIRIG